MSTFALSGVPGTIISCEFNAKQARKADDVGQQPARLKTVTLLLDVSDERFMLELLKIFPGLDFTTKAMGSAEQAGAAQVRVEKKLPEISIFVGDVEGKEVLKAEVARTKGKPTLRISAGARKLQMPLTISAGLPRSTVQKIDDYIGADVLVNVAILQSDLDDAVVDSGEQSPKKGKAKEKTSVPVVDDNTGQPH